MRGRLTEARRTENCFSVPCALFKWRIKQTASHRSAVAIHLMSCSYFSALHSVPMIPFCFDQLLLRSVRKFIVKSFMRLPSCLSVPFMFPLRVVRLPLVTRLSVCRAHALNCCFVSASVAPRLKPSRRSSSRLRHPGKLHFVLNVVEFPACSGRPAGRRGLCTGWLFDLINPVLVFPGTAVSSSSPALPKVMSTLENKEMRPECTNRETLSVA